ncbi:MAG: HD domain-containing protein [Candidatus Pacearchaeota archaeon]|jgi:uncharacterized protein
MDNKHLIAVTGIIVKDGKYLITKRALSKKTFPGKWTVPGGNLEITDYINRKKDTSIHWYSVLEDVLKREIFEEVGLEVENINYVTSMTFIKGDEPMLILSLYCDYKSGEVKLNEESCDFAWISLTQAKNYELIEGIYEELEMLDRLLNGKTKKIGEWKKEESDIKIIIQNFVQEECKKPTSKYGYEPYECHFVPVVKYSKLLGEKLNADLEILELAAWLHDIGSIIYGRENHHITSSEIAENKLTELNYPIDKIKHVKHCILAHRGSQNIVRETIEAQILADADSMSHFDNICGPLKAALVYEGLNQVEAINSVKSKLIRSYSKLSEEAKQIIKPKYNAAMLLFGGENGICT